MINLKHKIFNTLPDVFKAISLNFFFLYFGVMFLGAAFTPVIVDGFDCEMYTNYCRKNTICTIF